MLMDKIAEEKILEAQKKGRFSNLPGSGKPLPMETISIPEDLRMAYHMLKTADFLPPELELRKEIHTARELLEKTPDLTTKHTIITRINIMIRKINMAQPSRPDREIPEEYLPRLVDRIEQNQC
ncbi:DUF1992 domain-containing protein [Desulfobotulus sp. H1]|uniref:DUF1992 domain-containing protein n=1 Tax=Desulfobotulus pelophilus TaxID=2823377 RepID=A0ABT3NB08_9BACT|nr:DUF1992 domain-containing protein [Desulfobotulus pelophilus]MCW7754642.1 DUF1992 domain-containing protein [Desulfobotulus pelophilus]